MKFVAKSAIIAGLAAVALAGSVATAEFLTYSPFQFNGGKIDRLLPIEASDGVVASPMLYGESSDVKVRIHNPNRKQVVVKLTTADFGANAVEVTNGPAACKSEIVLPSTWEAYRGTFAPGETRTVTLADYVSVKNDAPSNCQGVEFKINTRAFVEGGGYR